MKKIFVIFLLGIIIILLSSCQVNWFDEHYDVPWWVIAVPVVIFSLIVWIAVCKYISSKKYVCPNCNKDFCPKWWKAGLSIHINGDHLFKCPHCGKKDFCHSSRETRD